MPPPEDSAQGTNSLAVLPPVQFHDRQINPFDPNLVIRNPQTRFDWTDMAYATWDELRRWSDPVYSYYYTQRVNSMRQTPFGELRYGSKSLPPSYLFGDLSPQLRLAMAVQYHSRYMPGVGRVTKPERPVRTRLMDLVMTVPRKCTPTPKPSLKERPRPWEVTRPPVRTSWDRPEIRRPKNRAGKRI